MTQANTGQLKCVRGAVDVVEDTPEAITEAVKNLMHQLIDANQLTPQQVIAIFFTVTPDLHTANPAWAYRHSVDGDAWQLIPLLCSQEPIVSGMMEKVVRVLIQWYPAVSSFEPKPVYLGKTASLRPDLIS